MTTYCEPGALFRCAKCGTARTRPEYLADGACKEAEWCEKQQYLAIFTEENIDAFVRKQLEDPNSTASRLVEVLSALPRRRKKSK